MGIGVALAGGGLKGLAHIGALKALEELGVKDSKKLTDEKILEIVPKLIKIIPYESIILSNKEYNLKYNSNININKIK